MDKIFIRQLNLRCIIGIFPDERKEKQDVVVNVMLEGDFSKAERSDDIRHAANYKTITKNIIQMVEDSQFYLVEALAGRIAEICLKSSKVKRATVTLDKPGALRYARSVAVEITRSRSHGRVFS